MFELKSIQAGHGDALLVSYGHEIVRHILVDGGPAHSLNNLLAGQVFPVLPFRNGWHSRFVF